MGNEQGKVQLKPDGSQSYIQSSQINNDEKGIYHKNANAFKPGPVIYLPESVTGPALKTTEIEDPNNYIRVKVPAQSAPLRPTRGEDYSKEIMSSDLNKSLVGFLHEYKATHKRVFALKIEEENGVGQQADMLSFDYEKKLLHFVKKPQNVESKVR